MLTQQITSQMLLNEPQLLSQFLEDITDEIHTPYLERIHIYQNDELKNVSQGIIEEISKKEDQLKLLIEFINFMMEKCEEKIQLQHDRLEKQEDELNQIKDENTILNLALQDSKKFSCQMEDKLKELEESLSGAEKKKEEVNQDLILAQTKIANLNERITKFEELNDEETIKVQKIEKLEESMEDLGLQIDSLKKENFQLKGELELSLLKANQFDDLSEEYNKLNIKYEKSVEDLESEKLQFKTKKKNLQAEIILLKSRIESLQVEIREVKKKAIQPFNKRNDSEESQNNLNAKFSLINSRSHKTGQHEEKKSLFDEIHAEGEDEQIFEEKNEFVNLQLKLSDIQSGGGHKGRQGSLVEKKDSQEESVKHENSFENDLTDSSGSKRKDIFEEFFSLSFQSALLNSPNFDDLAGTEMKGLYEEVMKKNIPFHKWYTWIVARLAHIYKEEIVPQMSGWMTSPTNKE